MERRASSPRPSLKDRKILPSMRAEDMQNRRLSRYRPWLEKRANRWKTEEVTIFG